MKTLGKYKVIGGDGIGIDRVGEGVGEIVGVAVDVGEIVGVAVSV